mmetsp:Transcript_40515/g.114581  ORF Transcript_40515/g.114581 Transcript_40515/m.114581 type:complete len:238 (+) Transcript_40515:708-1421(+)
MMMFMQACKPTEDDDRPSKEVFCLQKLMSEENARYSKMRWRMEIMYTVKAFVGVLPLIICLNESASYSSRPYRRSASSKAMFSCCCMVHKPMPTFRSLNSKLGRPVPEKRGAYSSRGATMVFTKRGSRSLRPSMMALPRPFSCRPSTSKALLSMTKPTSTMRGSEVMGAAPMASSTLSTSLGPSWPGGGEPRSQALRTRRSGCTWCREMRTAACRTGSASVGACGTATTCRCTVPFL